jgi:predicted DNA-binding transcriptional regulator YafY
VDTIHAAIAANRVITFRYFEYDMRKEKVYRREGGLYRVTPFGLIWDSENYYLASWDEERQELRHYRVDKMSDITVTGAQGKDRGDWDPEGYASRHSGMFAGRACQLRLRCEARMAGILQDRFGRDVMMVPDGDDHFTVTLDVVVSPNLWGWLFGLGDGVEVLSPGWAAEDFKRHLEDVLELYQK